MEKEYVSGCGVFIYKSGRFLLGKRADGQGWSCAGGKIEDGELPQDAMVREAKEEFGVDVKRSIYLGMSWSECLVRGVHSKVLSHMFLCLSFDGDPTPKLDEMTELKWVHFEDLMKIQDIFMPTKSGYLTLLKTPKHVLGSLIDGEQYISTYSPTQIELNLLSNSGYRLVVEGETASDGESDVYCIFERPIGFEDTLEDIEARLLSMIEDDILEGENHTHDEVICNCHSKKKWWQKIFKR